MAVEAKTPRELELERRQAEADVENKKLSGVGLRTRIGQTRGKSPQIISWKAFDESQPETLPTSIQQFTDTVGAKDEKVLLSYLISGFNDEAYTAASDPLAEYVNPTWSPEVQTNFRLVVRNYAKGLNMSLEDAVNLIKPGYEKQFGA
jgi:hypothetical protein